MSMEVIPGSGRDGGEPFVPVPGDAFCGEGEDAWLRRVMAEADADEGWVSEELAGAGRRPAGRAAWIQRAAAAEFAARRREPDRKKATALGFTPFACDELAPELLRDGRISEFQLKIITESTGALSDQDAAEADRLLAAAAPGLTPGKLRAMCTRVVMMIDPAAAQRRKDSAARDARVIRFQEHSGTAALCGRDLPPEEVLASSGHIDGCARELRAAGIPGTLAQLRVRAYLDLTQGIDPLARITPAGSGPDEPGGGRSRPPGKAVITLLVPAGTLYGWSPAPGEITGFGLLDPQATRDLTQAASAHPETRWCVTVIGPAHGVVLGTGPG